MSNKRDALCHVNLIASCCFETHFIAAFMQLGLKFDTLEFAARVIFRVSLTVSVVHFTVSRDSGIVLKLQRVCHHVYFCTFSLKSELLCFKISVRFYCFCNQMRHFFKL